MGKIGWATKDPYGLGLRNAIWLANEDFKQRKKARAILAVDKVAQEATDELSDLYTDWDLGCCVLALHRKYGYEGQEIADFLDDVQKIVKELYDAGYDRDAVWEKVAEETGVAVDRIKG